MELVQTDRRQVLLADLHRMAAEGTRAAATRTEHLRWVAVSAVVAELEDETTDGA